MSVYLPWIKDPATGRRRQSKVYWYDFTYLGQRIRESANTTRRSLAENAAYERRKSLEKSATGGKIQLIRQKRLKRVADALTEYEKAYAVNHRESGLQIVKERSAHLVAHLCDLMAVDLTREKILDYMATRKAEGVSNRTVNMEIEVLSRAMEMNFEGVKKLEEARDVGRALPDEEEERLIGAAARSHSPVLHMALRIALATGMRHDEIRLLQMLQIDFEQKHFVVGKAKTEGGEGRVIPFGPELEAALKMYLNRYAQKFGAAMQPDWYLFPFSNRKAMLDPTRPITSWKRAWELARKEAGVTCRFHDLRHTCCTKMAEAGVPESTMKAIMGHLSARMLERYSHIRMKAKREAILAVEARTAVASGRQTVGSHVKQSPQQAESADEDTLQ